MAKFKNQKEVRRYIAKKWLETIMDVTNTVSGGKITPPKLTPRMEKLLVDEFCRFGLHLAVALNPKLKSSLLGRSKKRKNN